ncbi:MAG: hypothetical protein RJA44_2415 [Pseudomonadota bacterium]
MSLDPTPALAAPDAPLTLAWPGGLQIELSCWGASWLSCRVPVDAGWREALLPPRQARVGGDQPRSFMGATLGRYANRIGHGRLRHGDQQWTLARAPGELHQLHGGPQGWDRQCWQLLAHSGTQLRLQLESPAGDQGFPGHARAWVSYELLDAATLQISWEAEVDAPCPLGLSNHVYFNLDPRDARGGCSDVRGHRLRLHASRFLPVDASLLPLAQARPVESAPDFDFRQLRTLQVGTGALPTALQPTGGHDHAFLIDATDAGDHGGTGDAPHLRPAATLQSQDGRLQLDLATSHPALQLYTGQGLGGLPAPQGRYRAFAGLALEPEPLPDSPNRPEWWPELPEPVWWPPSRRWRHQARYRFSSPV